MRRIHTITIAAILINGWLAIPVFAQPDRVVWDFSEPKSGWSPRSPTITVERVGLDRPPAGLEGKFCLRISGSIGAAWNYATSTAHPMQPGQCYRLTGWVKVDKTGAATPPPYFKCELVPAEGKAGESQMTTDRYDKTKLGTWQRLTCEFRAPETIDSFWVALEKGTDGPTEIDAAIAAVSVEPIQGLTQFQLSPLPIQLNSKRGIHSRLFLNEAQFAELKRAVATTHAEIWQQVKRQADEAVKAGPPKYIERDAYSGDEQLWQRQVGNTMPTFAMAWRLTGDVKYLEAARAWALAACGYATWGLGSCAGVDLATGHQLFGLAIIYDWCFKDLDEESRTTIRKTLIRRGSYMFETACVGGAHWSNSYLQNHLWVNSTGLAAAGFAVFDEYDEANRWFGFALNRFKRTMQSLGADGASHEGVGYWEYGVEYLLKFMELANQLLGEDLYGGPGHDWWRNTAAYPQYLALPQNAWTRTNCIVDIADCPRGNWYGPDYLLRRLAGKFNDGHAQWLAEELATAHVCATESGWLNLIWYDPKVKSVPPANLPTFHEFNDLGIVSARTSWSGSESLVVFKCGPFIGQHATPLYSYDPGGGHVHPDANHFVLFGGGGWLIRDDGYQDKWTRQHNTLLIGGRGQLGEGHEWLRGSEPLAAKTQPRILAAESTAKLDHMAGDATAAYPAELGLKRFIRHLIFLKPNVLIVADDIEVAEDQLLELRFHPESEMRITNGLFSSPTNSPALQLKLLTPAGVDASAGWQATASANHGKGVRLFSIRFANNTRLWRNAIAIAWSPDGRPLPDVSLQIDGDRYRFTTADQVVELNWQTGQLKAQSTR